MAWLLIIVGLVLVAIAFYVKLYLYPTDKSSVRERQLSLRDSKHSTQMTHVAAKRETKVAGARADLLQEVNREARALEALDEHHKNSVLKNAQRDYSINEIQNKNNLLLLADEGQVDLDTYLELKRKSEMDRLELERQWKEAEQQLKAGFIYQLQGHQHLSLMTEYIGSLYNRARQLQSEGKDREYKLIEEHIEFMEGDFRGRQRLLQVANQEDIQGSDSNTDSGGDGSKAVQTAQE